MNTTSLVRLSFISLLFIINLLCLIKMIFHQRLNHCIHTTTCAFIVVASTAYLSSWLPYLFHSFYNSTVWPILEIRDHCIIQHSVSGQITTILFAILCVRKLYDAFSPAKARTMSYAACIAWIIPQLVYLTMAEIVNVDDNNSFHFLDRVQPTNSTLHPSDHKLVSQGFMICVHKLSSAVIAQMSWHYVVLVIPMTAMLLICLAANYLKDSLSKDSKKSKDGQHCNCSTDIILIICLYANFLWLLLLRPLVVLRSLLTQTEEETSQWSPSRASVQSLYLDLGTHLILIVIAILVPFSTQGGFRTDIKQKLRTNAKQLNSKYCPSNAIKALEADYYDLDVPRCVHDTDSARAIKLNNSALY